MKIVFIHKFFPGQFKHLVRACLAAGQHRVVAIGQTLAREASGDDFSGCDLRFYRPAGACASNTLLQRISSDTSNGKAVADVLLQLRTEGFVPDLIIAHSGWGESLFCKDVFPSTPVINYFELYYRSDGSDVDFGGLPVRLEERIRIRTLNAGQLLDLASCDAGISPTLWQKQSYPAELQGKIHVLHEGVDIQHLKPNPSATFALPNGQILERGEEIVTYAARNLEPYRGFPQFMQAVAMLQQRRPHLQVLIAGGDDAGYSRGLASGKTYREQVCSELSLDQQRIHFLGWLPRERHIALLQVSSAHVYLTIPFVLSWSMLEAMAVGCTVIASDTAPVREVIEHGRNGLLCDFFSPMQIAAALEQVLDHPQRMKNLGAQARRDIAANYNQAGAFARYSQLIEHLTGQPLAAAQQCRETTPT